MTVSINGVDALKAEFDAHKVALDPHLAESLPVLVTKGNLLVLPTNAGWSESFTNSGTFTSVPSYQMTKPGTDPSSMARLAAAFYGFSGTGPTYHQVDWDKKFYLYCVIRRNGSDSESMHRIQIKQASGEGALDAKGIGWKIDNLSVYGESYGTELGEVDLSTVLTQNRAYRLLLIHYPAEKIEWYVDGTLVGTQATAAKIPSGYATSPCNAVHSSINGQTGGIATYFALMRPVIWQEL